MNPLLSGALVAVLVTTITQIIIAAVIFGGMRQQLKSHSELLAKLPCLKPKCLDPEG